MKDIFIIGSKGIPAKYGGFETFVEKLTEYQIDNNIRYHIACLGDESSEFIHNGARCFSIDVPNIGPSKAIYYDILALKEAIKYIKFNNLKDVKVYILACRIGPFIKKYKRILNKMNIELWVNPDGHEWKRKKWNCLTRNYWKLSERLMVKNSDLIICDSKNIEKYIKSEYKQYNPNTKFIAYGANVETSSKNNNLNRFKEWLKEKKVIEKEYYLIVGRFVPENNYEIIINEFMKSKTKKDLVIITNYENNKFYKKLNKFTKFDVDKRIKFVGTVYNQELLRNIRKNAYAYIHGHEVGGTNPSLLEALAVTNLNILLDVGFNKEVAEDSAIYFSKQNNSLSEIINNVDQFSDEFIKLKGNQAKERILNYYSWRSIVDCYEKKFLE
ncbi:TPA: glycosyltransferase family 1 protein [Clostridium perfringens]|nr:glycosyltransferase family 1 protein [Clostridium perfringens]